ncbi:LCP family protein required for cell wall assembly [Bacilli bacterium PM5-3]|nr:LCP family protein required for cell wall assembly [Bacilli bacterium PM5-3]
MKKKLHIIMVVEIVLISLLTMANLIYTFQSLKYTVVSKLIIVAFCFLLAILLINILFDKFFQKKWQMFITILIVIALNYGFFQVNLFLYNYNVAMGRIQVPTTYKTSLIAKKDSEYNKVDDINSNTTIGIQSIKYYENGQMALDEIKKLNKTDNIKQYSSLKKAFTALQNNEIDMMSVKGLSDETLLDIDSNLSKNYKVITTFETKEKVEAVKKDIISEPFTILISGIDSRSSKISDVSNSDSNVLVTFNPKTGRVTTLTTPRDSYVQIQCGGYGYDKLTHAAAYGGTKCVKKTLEKLYDVKVDYTVRINFVGVIEIVDALGGIEIDVPTNTMNVPGQDVCEQDSHGKKGTICWKEGEVNKFNGESALAFARNRYKQDGGDFYRGRNQQVVIEAILNKATQINNIDTINKLLTTISKHMSTNINTSDIISLYEILVGMDNSINIEKLYISGSTGMVGAASVVYPNTDDMKYATYRMKVALEEVYPQFPTNGYYVEAQKPSNADGNNPLRTQKMPFDYQTPTAITKTSE